MMDVDLWIENRWKQSRKRGVSTRNGVRACVRDTLETAVLRFGSGRFTFLDKIGRLRTMLGRLFLQQNSRRCSGVLANMNMKLQALIWDVDGTLANTERDGHLPAVNEASAAVGQPLNWSWQEFQKRMVIPGNANRFQHELTERGLPQDEIKRLVAEFTKLKKQIYIEKYVANLPLRTGVREMIDAAIAADVRQAIVSTSHEVQIHALLNKQLSDVKEVFRPILGKESGTKTAPESPLYNRCQGMLGIPAEHILVIEDSEDGSQAAIRAGLPCAVFYTDYGFGDDFSGARLVARSIQFFTLSQLSALCL